MAKKQFKAESKKLLDMMIHSIYTNKDIFLRELISNASDALDKLYYNSLTENVSGLTRDDYKIEIAADKDARTLTVSDNGCGMSEKELEQNLGTIAKSGSLDFKDGLDSKSEVEIIGQFGVGFYSAFMVADRVTVVSKVHGSDEAFKWESAGVDGYTVTPCEKETAGTSVTLYLKADTDDEKYSRYLDSYKIREIVSKYSDYIRYPIMMETETERLKEGSEDEFETVVEPTQLNSMVPLWRKNKNEITKEEYDTFYTSKFYDYEPPLHTIHSKTEGQISYDALLYIPAHASYDYYTKEFEKGLQLYTNGVLIMDKCSDLLPDYFSFVKGLVDSADLTLNISRETLQQDHLLKIIEKNLEKKIKRELEKLLQDNREDYEKFYKAFGLQLKFGVYNGFGVNKETLQDLLMFYSSSEQKLVTFKEYVSRMPEEQKTIYYACGETTDKIDMLPQAESVKAKGYEVLYCTDDVDEFAIQMLRDYDGKRFTNICASALDLDTEDEKQQVAQDNEDAKDLLALMEDALDGAVDTVRFTGKLQKYPVCLTSEGELSLEMEKVLDQMPNSTGVKATLALEINRNHPIAETLRGLYGKDDEKLKKYAQILYAQACLISGKPLDNPAQLSELICELM